MLAGSSTASVSPPSHSKNLNNSQSDVVSFRLSVEAQAQVSLNGSVPGQNGAFLGGETDLSKGCIRGPGVPLSSKPPSSSVSPSLRQCYSR